MERADYLIQHLSLAEHPEGGYFRETYRSGDEISGLPGRYPDLPRNFGTAIYYLLKRGQFSAFHKLKSDETWHFYEGSAIRLYIITENGDLKTHLLGNQVEKGELYQITVPHDCWFAAHPENPEKGYSLTGCTVAPGFDFNDFIMADRQQLQKSYPQHAAIIEKLTR